MRSFLLSLSFVGMCSFAVFSKPPAGHKIQLVGKIGTVNRNNNINAEVLIHGSNFDITVKSDIDGRFSAYFSEAPSFTVLVNAKGFESQEQTFAVPALKGDSTINVNLQLTPIEKLKLHGMIFDKKTSNPIAAEFDLYHDTDVVKEDVEIVADGKYSEALTNYGWYIIDISAKGYLNLSDTIWVMDCARPDLKRDYYLTRIEAGLTVRLRNIQFNFGKTSLHSDSFEELNDVAELLMKNPTLKLEIAGHTDSDGPDDYNLWLSQSRAQAVVDYLVSQGVPTSQLTAKGYGETKPIDQHDSMQAKAVNRRVEFTVLEN